MKWLMKLAFLLLLVPLPASAGSFLRSQLRHSRVKATAEAHTDRLKKEFASAKAAWPPSQVFLRGFKLEGELELWARGEGEGQALVRVRTFFVCAKSGSLGPKLKSGDGQVPEGVYRINRFNPRSSYHLSLGINYPNRVDLVRSKGLSPGGDIFIHGDCVTIGCLPLTDEPMEELYLSVMLARDEGQRSLPVHLFPCHFESPECRAILESAAPKRQRFWASLQKIDRAFRATKTVPDVREGRDGVYRVAGVAGRP